MFPKLCLFLLTLVLLGCENSEKLRSVNRIAIVSAVYDTRISEIENEISETEEEFIPAAFNLKNAGSRAASLGEDDRSAISSFFNELSASISSETGLIMIHPDDFKNKDLYTSLPIAYDRLHEIIPDSFRPVKLSDKNNAIALCASLGVDAVAMLKLRLYKMSKKGKLQGIEQGKIFGDSRSIYGYTKVKIILDTLMIDDNGIVVFERSIEADSVASIADADGSDIPVKFYPLPFSFPTLENKNISIALFANAAEHLFKKINHLIKIARS